MRCVVIVFAIFVASLASAQTTVKPLDTSETWKAKPLIHEEQKPYLWNSKLIKGEREGVIAPAMLWPEEHLGLKDFILRHAERKYLDSVAIPSPLLDTPPMQAPAKGSNRDRQWEKRLK